MNELTIKELDELPVGAKIQGVNFVNRTSMVAVKRELYDGLLTWDVEDFGSYRSRSLQQIGFGWHEVKDGD